MVRARAGFSVGIWGLWLTLGSSGAACSESAPKPLAQGAVLSSASAGSGNAAGSGGTWDDRESRYPSLELNPQDEAEEKFWLAADKYKISFRAESCYGWCPAYEYSVDQDGQLHFEGRAYVARPGVYDTTLNKDHPSLHDMIRFGFLRLNDRYREEEDGCVVATDNPSYVMRVDLPDRSKEVDFYLGCKIKGPAHTALRDLVDMLDYWIGSRGFTELSTSTCRLRGEMQDWRVEAHLQGSYVLLDSRDEPAGLLRVTPVTDERFDTRRSWEVLSCHGEALFGREIGKYHGCESVLLPPEGSSTFQWPGIERPVNAAVIYFQDNSTTSTDVLDLHLLDANSEIRHACACR
jgi:hypothetical protein